MGKRITYKRSSHLSLIWRIFPYLSTLVKKEGKFEVRGRGRGRTLEGDRQWRFPLFFQCLFVFSREILTVFGIPEEYLDFPLGISFLWIVISSREELMTSRIKSPLRPGSHGNLRRSAWGQKNSPGDRGSCEKRLDGSEPHGPGQASLSGAGDSSSRLFRGDLLL